WGQLGERLNVLIQTNEERLVKAMEQFSDTVKKVGNTFGEENQRYLAATLKNVHDGTRHLETITRSTDELVQASKYTVQRVNASLTRTDDILNNMQQATKPMAQHSPGILKSLEDSTDRLNRITADIQDMLRTASQKDGTLRRLIADPSLYNNLNDAA